MAAVDWNWVLSWYRELGLPIGLLLGWLLNFLLQNRVNTLAQRRDDKNRAFTLLQDVQMARLRTLAKLSVRVQDLRDNASARAKAVRDWHHSAVSGPTGMGSDQAREQMAATYVELAKTLREVQELAITYGPIPPREGRPARDLGRAFVAFRSQLLDALDPNAGDKVQPAEVWRMAGLLVEQIAELVELETEILSSARPSWGTSPFRNTGPRPHSTPSFVDKYGGE